MKREFGIIGYPLHQSASPAFFNKKFADESIDAQYLPFEIENIEDIREVLKTTPLDGFNVTIPYKESIIPYLDSLDDAAREVGAVNCVEIKDGKVVGQETA